MERQFKTDKEIMESPKFSIYKDSSGERYFVKFEGSEEKQIQKFEYDELARVKQRLFELKMKDNEL